MSNLATLTRGEKMGEDPSELLSLRTSEERPEKRRPPAAEHALASCRVRPRPRRLLACFPHSLTPRTTPACSLGQELILDPTTSAPQGIS